MWSATMPRVRIPALDGQDGAHAACFRRHLMDIIIVSGVASIVDDAMSVMVWPEPFTHRWSMWSGLLLHARQLLW